MPTHWKKLNNPDYLGAYAFDPGEEKVGTIAYVRQESVMGADGKKEECTVAHFTEKELKPLILNVTNCKAITKLYKSPYIEDWAGKAIVMRVQNVKAFGEVVEAVRIKPEIPKVAFSRDVICDECGGVLTAYGKMNPAQLAAYTRKKYGKTLCADCAAAEIKKDDTTPEQSKQDEAAQEHTVPEQPEPDQPIAEPTDPAMAPTEE